jgi:cob(I)alamin adenosyltransferase
MVVDQTMKKPSSITTCYGDEGFTRLYSGERVFKDDLRIETCGALDELVSVLGTARAFCRSRRLRKELENIQRSLFRVGAEVAMSLRVGKKPPAIIGEHDVAEMDRLCAYWDTKSAARDFVLPGNSRCGAFLDVARSVARRAERRLVTLRRRNRLNNGNVLRWINRLSDVLWLMARAGEKRATFVKHGRE